MSSVPVPSSREGASILKAPTAVTNQAMPVVPMVRYVATSNPASVREGMWSFEERIVDPVITEGDDEPSERRACSFDFRNTKVHSIDFTPKGPNTVVSSASFPRQVEHSPFSLTSKTVTNAEVTFATDFVPVTEFDRATCSVVFPTGTKSSSVPHRRWTEQETYTVDPNRYRIREVDANSQGMTADDAIQLDGGRFVCPGTVEVKLYKGEEEVGGSIMPARLSGITWVADQAPLTETPTPSQLAFPIVSLNPHRHSYSIQMDQDSARTPLLSNARSGVTNVMTHRGYEAWKSQGTVLDSYTRATVVEDARLDLDHEAVEDLGRIPLAFVAPVEYEVDCHNSATMTVHRHPPIMVNLLPGGSIYSASEDQQEPLGSSTQSWMERTLLHFPSARMDLRSPQAKFKCDEFTDTASGLALRYPWGMENGGRALSTMKDLEGEIYGITTLGGNPSLRVPEKPETHRRPKVSFAPEPLIDRSELGPAADSSEHEDD
ncbi:hypothetical protein I316_01211 [Kwoniella heveanensis BCC8398]|uniref:Uncharacterized protein n=1 Tax=Kwoniella heveanensis BCC8398 TaxID=1296120 RepID=A0A1B9H1Z0_9TREE|nr:hypothetical protein I316_01211 [Kwoniella heveanensis BCC8398]